MKGNRSVDRAARALMAVLCCVVCYMGMASALAEEADKDAAETPSFVELRQKSSAELAEEVAASQGLMAIFLSSDLRPERQVQTLWTAVPALSILRWRADGAAALLQVYTDSTAMLSHSIHELAAHWPGVLRFECLEVILSVDPFLDKMETQGKLNSVIEAVVQSVEAREAYNAAQPEPVYGTATGTAATLVSRCLQRLKDEEYQRWVQSLDAKEPLDSVGHVYPREILRMGKERIEKALPTTTFRSP